MIRLGRDYENNKTLSEDQAYIAGVNQFVLEFSVLKKIFDEDQELREHCIIVVSNSSGDGVSGVVEHSAYFQAIFLRWMQQEGPFINLQI